jgi:hypothetical protein
MASPGAQFTRKPRSGAAAVATLALAVALGLALQHIIQIRLGEIQTLAGHDVIRARAELAGILHAVAICVFGATGALGIAFFVASRHAHREERFPPSGAWAWRSARIVTGPRARTLARAAMGLAVALVLLSIAAAGLTWYVASVLLACRAT